MNRSPTHAPAPRLTGAHNDPAERLRQEQEARHFQSIVESSDDAIISKSLDSVVTSWNPGAQAMFGWRADEMLGRPITVLLPPDRLNEEELILARLKAGERVDHFETVRIRKDGRPVHVSVTISPIRDRQGQVVGASKIARDIGAKKALESRLEHLAHHDALTDLPNRVLLADRIQQSLILARRQGFNVAVLYIDLDGFKQVNDAHGHAAGDALLIALSQRMKEALREVDTLARIGGDEFAGVLSDVKGMDECRHLLQRVLQACASPVPIGGQPVRVSASIGVAVYPQDDVPAEELLRHADQAMYLAKQAGKNQYRIFGS
jgi:diguanylate cyclase (GGDEF)-like protein/PAS domain S-box-containing protein